MSDGLRSESEKRFSESDGLIRSPSEVRRSPSEVRQLPTALFFRRTPKTSDGLRSDSSDVRSESVGLQSDFSESEKTFGFFGLFFGLYQKFLSPIRTSASPKRVRIGLFGLHITICRTPKKVPSDSIGLNRTPKGLFRTFINFCRTLICKFFGRSDSDRTSPDSDWTKLSQNFSTPSDFRRTPAESEKRFSESEGLRRTPTKSANKIHSPTDEWLSPTFLVSPIKSDGLRSDSDGLRSDFGIFFRTR